MEKGLMGGVSIRPTVQRKQRHHPITSPALKKVIKNNLDFELFFSYTQTAHHWGFRIILSVVRLNLKA